MFLEDFVKEAQTIDLKTAPSPVLKIEEGEIFLGVLPIPIRKLWVVWRLKEKEILEELSHMTFPVSLLSRPEYELDEQERIEVKRFLILFRLRSQISDYFWNEVRLEFSGKMPNNAFLSMREGWRVVLLPRGTHLAAAGGALP